MEREPGLLLPARCPTDPCVLVIREQGWEQDVVHGEGFEAASCWQIRQQERCPQGQEEGDFHPQTETGRALNWLRLAALHSEFYMQGFVSCLVRADLIWHIPQPLPVSHKTLLICTHSVDNQWILWLWSLLVFTFKDWISLALEE